MGIDNSLPTDLASAHALIVAQRQALSAAEIRAATAESEAQCRALLIEKLKFTIRNCGTIGSANPRSVVRCSISSSFNSPIWRQMLRKPKCLGEAQVHRVSKKMVVPSFERRRPARRPLPAHLPRERTVYPALTACPCCGGTTLRKIS